MSNEVAEYDPAELEKLVSEALGEINTSGPRDLFSFGDTQMLSHLMDVLPEYVQHHGDVQVILGELREKLYEGMAGHQERDVTLRQIHTAVTKCRKCPMMQPEPLLPRWNLRDPDVVFITDMPAPPNEATALLVDTLKEVGFTSSRIALTSVTRCHPNEQRLPNSDEVSNCAQRFLFTELQLWQPKLIVPLGGLAASVLLGEQVKITKEHGRLFWVGPWAISPTIAPGYAIRNENTRSQLDADLRQAHRFVYGKI